MRTDPHYNTDTTLTRQWRRIVKVAITQGDLTWTISTL